MKIEKLEIRNFGKMQNRTLEFSDGIQLISGENESGKSTVHTFIRSMLFGMTRGRGRAAKNDVYSRYEPWENPAYYAGEMVLESGGKRFRLTRNFGRQNANAKLVCLTDGEVLSVEDGDLSMLPEFLSLPETTMLRCSCLSLLLFRIQLPSTAGFRKAVLQSFCVS